MVDLKPTLFEFEILSESSHESESESQSLIQMHRNHLKYTYCCFLPFLYLQIGKGSRGKKIHYSGPLLVPSGKVDQMLKDHDRHVQEAVRRARLDKERMRKLQVEGNKLSTNSLFVSGR